MVIDSVQLYIYIPHEMHGLSWCVCCDLFLTLTLLQLLTLSL